MRTLTGQSIPHIVTGDPDYPYGRIQDETVPGAGDGTPLTELAGLADIYQGVIEQMRLAGVTPDEAEEKKEASQIVEAFGWFAPVCVLRVGTTLDNATFRVLGGKYQPGYTATMAYEQFASDRAEFKLSILKGGSASATEKYLVSVSNAFIFPDTSAGGDTAAIGINALHDLATDGQVYFKNDTSANIMAATGSVTDAGESNLQAVGMIITVHRVV